MIVFKMFCILVICVIVIDISGFIDSFKTGLKWLITKGKFSNSDYRLKPIDCSFCMSFWVNCIYLLWAGCFTIPYITLALILPCFAMVIKDTILIIRDTFTKLINLFYEKFID